MSTCVPAFDPLASEESEGIVVTFNPPLYLQRQAWLLSVLTREKVRSVLDIGCGEGNLIRCLTEPSIACLPPRNFHSSDELYIHTIHGLDPSFQDLQYTLERTAPTSSSTTLQDHSEHLWIPAQPFRWTSLKVHLWNGGFENSNYDAFGGDKVDAFVATEVIEHLTPELFPLFAPVLLGFYRPRLVLLTTPNYSYNQRFHPPNEPPLTGYPDPTGRTDRIFRHHDHKFEWTTEEWTVYCTQVAAEYGYEVEVGGIGKAVEDDPWEREDVLGHATLVATFRRISDKARSLASTLPMLPPALASGPTLLAVHTHLPYPVSSDELSVPPNKEDVYKAVQDALLDDRCKSLSLREIWRAQDVALACKGDVRHLLEVFKMGNCDADEWDVKDAENGWEIEITWNRFELPPTLEPEPRSSPTFVDSENEVMMTAYEDKTQIDWYSYPSLPEKDTWSVNNIIPEGWDGVPGKEPVVWGETD